MQTETHDIVIEAAKGTPAIAGAIASALTLNQWVMISTAVYIIIQALYLMRKWWREELDRAYQLARRGLEDAREDAEWALKHQAKETLQ